MGRGATRTLAAACVLAWCGAARAEPAEAPATVIKLAAVAPDGTAWAHELRVFDREVALATGGEVRFKFYLGGIAGDELAVLERIHRGELDAEAGANFCSFLASSLRVARIVGLFESRGEEDFLLARLWPTVEAQFRARGYVLLGLGTGFGETLFFSRAPARSLAELRKQRFWIWDLDEIGRLMLSDMGIPLAPLPLEDAARAYEDRRADGFYAVPTGALAFQWSAQARFFSDLRASFLPGCIAISASVFDSLSPQAQHTVTQAAGHLIERFDQIGHAQEDELVDGLFQKQGLVKVHADDAFRAEFRAAARAARAKLGNRLVPQALLDAVDGWLQEYRSRHVPK